MTTVRIPLLVLALLFSAQGFAATAAQTGVEMEALTAASVAALTVYDMAKAVDKTMTFSVELLEKVKE